MSKLYGMTFEECVLDYVTCLSEAPNGWGQNFSKKTGLISHIWLGKIYRHFGEERSQKAMAEYFAKNKEQ